MSAKLPRSIQLACDFAESQASWMPSRFQKTSSNRNANRWRSFVRRWVVVLAVDGLAGRTDEIAFDSVLQSALVNREGLIQRGECAIDIVVRVRVAHHQRRHQHAPADHLLQQQRTEGLRPLPALVL